MGKDEKNYRNTKDRDTIHCKWLWKNSQVLLDGIWKHTIPYVTVQSFQTAWKKNLIIKYKHQGL